MNSADPSNTSSKRRFPLTNNLSYMYQLYCSYILLFKNANKSADFMSLALLQQGLQKLVRTHYGPVGGWYEMHGDQIDVVYSDHKVNEPPFTTQTLDIDYDELSKHVNASNMELLVPDAPAGIITEASSKEMPMFIVKATYLRSNSGMALGVQYHHSLFDGATFWQFMNNWAYMCKTLHGAGLHPETVDIPYPPAFGFPSINEQPGDGDKKFEHTEYELVDPKDCVKEFQAGHEGTKEIRLRLEVSDQREIRAAARAAGVSFISMLSAMFWKELNRLRLAVKPTVGSELSLYTCTVNPRAALGLPANLCGSPVLNVASKKTVAEVAGFEVSELARLAQQTINNGQSPEYMRSSVKFLLAQRAREIDDERSGRQVTRKLILVYIIPAAVKCTMSSSRTFPIYDTDFGFGSPAYVRPPYLPFDGCWRIWPTPKDTSSESTTVNEKPIEIYLTQPEYIDPLESPLLRRFLLA
ncbi:hypothetical protein EV178_000131 [Coemansia sp. RSA 1646]|nr:hypothetical protein EV178_000131 [Coemansia sp. RSA 1646]